jgi:hypothetical protein
MSNEQGLQEILGNTWRECFSDKELIRDILSAVDVKYLHFKDIAKQYLINDDRVSLILTLEDEDKHLERAIIDIKTGFPTWEQMMDVIYTTGEGCEIKIVVFDGGKNPHDISNTVSIGMGFSALLSNSGVNINLLSAKVSAEDGGEKRLGFELFYEPIPQKRLPLSDIPPKGKFEQAELWAVYFCDMMGYSFPSSEDPNGWLDYTYWEHQGAFGLTPEWTQEGLFIYAVAQCDSEIEDMKWLWEQRIKEIREHFKDFEVTLHKQRGVPSKISLRVSDRSIRDVILSTPDEKFDYANEIHDALKEFRLYIEELIDEKIEEDVAKEKKM